MSLQTAFSYGFSSSYNASCTLESSREHKRHTNLTDLGTTAQSQLAG